MAIYDLVILSYARFFLIFTKYIFCKSVNFIFLNIPCTDVVATVNISNKFFVMETICKIIILKVFYEEHMC